jgi:hypothetical protein
MKKPLLSFLLLFTLYHAKGQFSVNALDFDGSNDQVDIATLPTVFSNPATNDFTIEAWINPRASIFARILFAQASASNFVSMGTNTGNVIYFYVIKNGVTVSVATTSGVPQNQWTHVAARWTSTSSTAEVFFNGILQTSVSGGSSTTGTSGLMTIGARTGGSQYFNGQLDEVRVWNTALSICQIQANMNNTIPATQANLIMNYHFNQGVAGATNTTVTALPDLSGNAYNGTLFNFALTGATSNWVSSTASVTATGFSTIGVSAVSSQTNISCNGASTGLGTVTASGVGPFTYTWMPGGGNAATAGGLSAGIYSVSIANSCVTITKTLAITQPTALLLNATASSSAICEGKTGTLTAVGSGGTGAISYTWTGGASSNTTVVTPASTSVYTVNATDANNCAASATVVLTVNPLPPVSLTAASTTACLNGGSILLTGSPSGGTYTGTNVSGAAFTPSASGTFTPSYSFTNSTTACSGTATTAIVVSLCTGISSYGNEESMVSVYPNPSNGAITVELLSAAYVSITNAIGRQVLVFQPMEAGKHALDLSNEADGIYFLKLRNNTQQSIIRLVKQ